MDKHGEMEFKWAADNIDVRKFNQWAINEDPTLYRNIVSPDHYWTQGDSVVRYRPQQGNAGALTVKCRKSKDSITDRLEVDLNLAGSVTARDVEVFLKATGWKHCFTLHKDAHIYWYKFPGHSTTLALYDVQAEGPCLVRRFLEIEVEKTSAVSADTAYAILDGWRFKLKGRFKLREPLNDSLYEIYSGKKYKIFDILADSHSILEENRK